jgi:hypothetical protein
MANSRKCPLLTGRVPATARKINIQATKSLRTAPTEIDKQVLAQTKMAAQVITLKLGF